MWNEALCIQCRDLLSSGPETFKSVPYKGLDLAGGYTVQVAPEDCTGCLLCVAVCPAKVLFNRFYQPDIDPAELETTPLLHLSSSDDLLLRLRWLAILSSTFRGSLAITGGGHQPIDAVKAVMAGAAAVQMVSALLRNGPNHLRYVREGFERWCEQHEYESIDQLRGAPRPG